MTEEKAQQHKQLRQAELALRQMVAAGETPETIEAHEMRGLMVEMIHELRVARGLMVEGREFCFGCGRALHAQKHWERCCVPRIEALLEKAAQMAR